MHYIFSSINDLRNHPLFNNVMYVFDEMQYDQNWIGQPDDHLLIKEIMKTSDDRKNVDYWQRLGGTNHQIIGNIIKNNYNLISNQIYTGNITVRYRCNTGNDEGVYEVI